MGKASNSYAQVVLRIGLHCESCVSTSRKAALACEGVKSATADKESNTLTVTGNVDPAKIVELLQKKMNKKVELISCTSKDKKASAKVIEVGCLCPSCIDEFKKIACETKGLEGWSCDKRKLTVKIEGKVDTKALTKTLKERLNKHGQIVPVSGNKKNVGGGGGGKLVLANGAGGSGGKVVVAEKQPEAVVVYGNAIVAQHVHFHISDPENLRLGFDRIGKSLDTKKGHK